MFAARAFGMNDPTSIRSRTRMKSFWRRHHERHEIFANPGDRRLAPRGIHQAGSATDRTGTEPGATSIASPARHALARDLWQALMRYRWRVAVAVILLTAAKLAGVAVPLVLRRIVDTLSRPEEVQLLPVALLIGYALLRFTNTLFTELRDLLFSRVTQRTVADYAAGVFAHLHRLGARFHGERRIGALLPDIERGTSGIGFLLGFGIFTLLPTLIEIGLVLSVIGTRYPWAYGGIIVATFALYAAFTVVFTARRSLVQRRVNRLDSHAKGRLADSLLNVDAVQQFTNEALESRRFGVIMQRWTHAAVNNQRALCVLHVGQSAVICMGVTAVMLAAGQDVVQHRMTVGDLVLINAFMLQVCLPLNTLGFVYREARDALVNAEKLFDLLNVPPEITAAPDAPTLQVSAAEVVFENVGFGYAPQRPTLVDVSLRINAGQTLAVVGGSGSGKSTLARLLLRFYDIDCGRILIDGQDIRSVSLPSLRQAIGVVPQDAALFNDSIAYNIAYGGSRASRAQVIEAARAAQLHELIMSLPQQYDTPVGERGVKLSGSEKQRIALARAILKNPPILIFDEATSALDAQSERAVQAALERLAKGRTTLIIAHRLSTIVDADAILVLDQGRVIEVGQHAQLLQAGGKYAQLWGVQQSAATQAESSEPAAASEAG
jgi:ATP-binding cassette subfamily B protein